MNHLKIKQRREELQYTQEYVAGKLGISQNTYSLLETGRSSMRVDQLILLAQVLDTDPNEFMQAEPMVVNIDNATIENVSGAGVVFNYSSVINLQQTNKEILEVLLQLTALLRTMNDKLQQ